MKFIKELEGRSYYYDLQRVPSGEYTLEFFIRLKDPPKNIIKEVLWEITILQLFLY